MRIRIVETEGYWVFADSHIADYHNDPTGDVSEETFGLWMAAEAAWKGYQAELTATYKAWSNREFMAEAEKDLL